MGIRLAVPAGLLALGAGVGAISLALAQSQPARVRVIFAANTRAAYEPFVERFNQGRADVQIEPLWGGDQTQLLAARRAPDLISTGDLYVAGQRDILLDLGPYLERDKAEVNAADYYPTLYSGLRYLGKQLALPTRFNVSLLYYNKDIFDAAKVAYPNPRWTQAQFVDAATKLTKTEGGRVAQWGSSTVFGWWGEWLIHVRQSGGDFMRGKTVTLDTPQAIRGLQFFFDKTTQGRYKFAPGPKDDALGGFQGQKTAMEYGGHTGLWTGYNQVKGFNWDIEVLPRGSVQQRGAELALEGLGVYNGTANKDAAWTVLKYLTGPEAIKIGFEKLGLPPARQSVARAALAVPRAQRASPKNLEALFLGITSGVTLPRDKEFVNTAIQVVQPQIDRMLEGKATPDEAARAAAERAQKYLDTVGK